jgi:acyl-CoA thioester hydrolase
VGAVFTHRIRVRYGECDLQGVVFNANYFAYFDVAMTEFQREALVPYDEMLAGGTDMVVAEASARFRGPARFDDEIDLDLRVVRLGTTGMTVRIDVLRDEELLVEGEMRYVFIDPDAKAKKPIPGDVRRTLEAYSAEEAAV